MSNGLTIAEIRTLEDQVNEQLGRLQLTNQIIRENVFRLLQDETHFLQYPIADNELCAFVCKKQGRLFSYINSYIPKDKQIFAAAHELYHIWYEPERLDQVEVLNNQTLEHETSSKSEQKANRFAAMLLVPEGILRQQLKTFRMIEGAIQLDDIVKLMPVFQVPYKTIVRRLHELSYISDKQLEAFLLIPDRDEKKGVMLQMKVLQLSFDSQQRSETIMLDGFIQNVLTAYQAEKIEYKVLRKSLALAGQSPENFDLPDLTEMIHEDSSFLLEEYDGDD